MLPSNTVLGVAYRKHHWLRKNTDLLKLTCNISVQAFYKFQKACGYKVGIMQTGFTCNRWVWLMCLLISPVACKCSHLVSAPVKTLRGNFTLWFNFNTPTTEPGHNVCTRKGQFNIYSFLENTITSMERYRSPLRTCQERMGTAWGENSR